VPLRLDGLSGVTCGWAASRCRWLAMAVSGVCVVFLLRMFAAGYPRKGNVGLFEIPSRC
jgi:hypothetical protein